MGWRAVSDAQMLQAGARVRVGVSGLALNLGMSESEIRAVIEKYSTVSVASLERTWGGFDIVGALADNCAAGWLRADMENALAALRADWRLAAITLSVGEIQVWEQSLIPEVPTTTAVSIAALALLAVVGVVVWRFFLR